MFDFDKKASNVGGWLTEAEGIFLYNMAKEVKTGCIVEIGSWKGKSTICLGNGSKDGNKVKIYAVDPHVGSSEHQKHFGGKVFTFEKFKRNIEKAGVAKYIEPIVDTSLNAAKKFTQPTKFIFIDGAHEYEYVHLDFKLWFPKVVNRGVLAFHDSWHFIGPNLATAIPLLTSSKIRKPRLIDTITYFEKVERNSLFDRLRNIVFIIYRTLWGLGGFLRLKYQGGNGYDT